MYKCSCFYFLVGAFYNFYLYISYICCIFVLERMREVVSFGVHANVNCKSYPQAEPFFLLNFNLWDIDRK